MLGQLFIDIFCDEDGRVVIVQFPNLPLFGWLGATLLSKLWPSGPQSLLYVFGQLCLLVWAFLEIRYGTTLFRRFLGIIVLAYMVYSNLFVS